MKSFRLLLFIVIILFFSCKTNEEPYWVSNPPPEDDIFFYLVGFSENDDVTNSLIEKLKDKYGFDSIYIPMVIRSEYLKGNSENITNIDEWISETGTYKLVRVRKSYIKPILDTFISNINDAESYISDFENSGDTYYNDGEYFKAYKLYLRALNYMLKESDLFYIPAIIRTMDKVLNILSPINFTNIRTIEKVKVGEAFFSKDNKEPVEHFFFNINGLNGSYAGFPFSVVFKEGWDSRERTSTVSILDNYFEFIPPRPKVSGQYGLFVELDLSDLISINSTIDALDLYFIDVKNKVEDISKKSQLSFTYSAVTNLSNMPKLVSFDPQIAGEGVVRRLLEDDTRVELAPNAKDVESLEYYIRELDRVTEEEFHYLIYCDNIDAESFGYDGDVLLKLSAEFRIIEIDNFHKVYSQKVNSEFIIIPGEEDIAYLDLGLKIGEILSSLKF